MIVINLLKTESVSPKLQGTLEAILPNRECLSLYRFRAQLLALGELNLKLSSSDMPDPTTQSNYLQVYTTNVDFNWKLDFSKQILEGTATHTLLAREAGIEEVM